MIRIHADLLTIGDVIVTLVPDRNGNMQIKDRTPVLKLSPCEASFKGVRKMHVNGSLCYDTIPMLDVIPVRGKYHGQS